MIYMKYFKKIIGERIYLSPRSSEDVEIFTQWLNDFETTDYIGMSGTLTTLEGEKKYLEENNTPEATFVIVTIEDNKMLGSISLERINHINRSATLGIFIGDKDFRCKGYGTEAIQLLLEYGFKYLNLHSIKLDLLSVNERAHKCYLKCGFKDTGASREAIFLNGKYYDRLYMEILESEFKGNYIRNKNI